MGEPDKVPASNRPRYAVRPYPIVIFANTFALLGFNHLINLGVLRISAVFLLLALTCLEASHYGTSLSTSPIATGRTRIWICILLGFVLGTVFFTAMFLQIPYTLQSNLLTGFLCLLAGALSFYQGRWLSVYSDRPNQPNTT